ncbi:MAG: MnmC family methyltransferase [Planctomycetota bacterium]
MYRADRASNRTWKRLLTEDGSPTLLHPEHGEACHDRTGAWTQATGRYAAGCRLRERARAGGTLRLLDVGTGLGWNLAAAVQALWGTGARLAAVTLELDPAPIRSALALPRPAGLPPGAGESHEAVRAALERALAAGGSGEPVELDVDGGPPGTLALHLGDARRTLPELAPEVRFDAVFLDPFSPAQAPELWEPEVLGEIARRMAPGSLLATYSAATRVRVALARHGLGVARGPEVGRKREGTLAGPGLVAGPEDADLVRRIRRHLKV